MEEHTGDDNSIDSLLGLCIHKDMIPDYTYARHIIVMRRITYTASLLSLRGPLHSDKMFTFHQKLTMVLDFATSVTG